MIELVPHGRPMKGDAVERLAGRDELGAVLFAGDDRADVDAFFALDRLQSRGVMTLRVAVRGDETPFELVDAADLVVDGPRARLVRSSIGISRAVWSALDISPRSNGLTPIAYRPSRAWAPAFRDSTSTP